MLIQKKQAGIFTTRYLLFRMDEKIKLLALKLIFSGPDCNDRFLNVLGNFFRC